MSRTKLIFIIALIMVVLATISFFILKKYSTIFADTTNNWTYTTDSSGNPSIITDGGYNAKYTLYLSDIADITSSNFTNLCAGYTKCRLFKIAPSNFLNTGLGNIIYPPNIAFPNLALVITSYGSVQSINSAYIYIPADVDSGTTGTTSGKADRVKSNCGKIIAKGQSEVQGYLCNLDWYQSYTGLNGDSARFNRTTLNNLNLSKYSWLLKYYNYVLGLKNVTISANDTNSTTNTALPDTVKQACDGNLVQKPLDTSNMPAEITNAFNAIRTKFGQPNFDPASVFGGQQGLKDYLTSLHATFQVNHDKPWENYNTVKSRLTNDENALSGDIDNIWTQANAIQDTKSSAIGCAAGAAFAGAAAAVGGTGFSGFKIASVGTEVGCTALAAALNTKISNDTKQKFLTDVAKTVYDSYYSTKYLTYLNCIANDTNTPQAIKDIINKQLNDIQSQLLTLQALQKEGSDAAAQGTSFWDTLLSGFTDIMRNLMATILNFLWKNIFDSSPL